MKTRGLRSNSRPTRFADLDRRTAEGRLFDQFRRELVTHVGGAPGIVQRSLIDRVCWIRLRIALMDEKLATGGMSDQDSKSYLAWCNTLARLLTALGVEPPAAKPPTIADIAAEIAARRAQGQAA